MKMPVPKNCYVITDPLPKSKFAKIRKWLDNEEAIEVSTDSHDRLWLFNRTKIVELEEKG